MYPYREMFYTLDDRVKKALVVLCSAHTERALEILTLAREESIKIYEHSSDPFVPDESNLPNEKTYSRRLRCKKVIVRKMENARRATDASS